MPKKPSAKTAPSAGSPYAVHPSVHRLVDWFENAKGTTG